ncbi:MAG TPA: hypothetical protein VMW41_02590 [Candidatus Bathyarchaeia archaeon]|nr:hypothetical protein [Candidatus Bathyarchaeia archaeon]
MSKEAIAVSGELLTWCAPVYTAARDFLGPAETEALAYWSENAGSPLTWEEYRRASGGHSGREKEMVLSLMSLAGYCQTSATAGKLPSLGRCN